MNDLLENECGNISRIVAKNCFRVKNIILHIYALYNIVEIEKYIKLKKLHKILVMYVVTTNFSTHYLTNVIRSYDIENTQIQIVQTYFVQKCTNCNAIRFSLEMKPQLI